MEHEEQLQETVLEAKTVYEGRVFRVEECRVALSQGAVVRRDVVKHPGAVCVLPLLSDGQVYLVKQWRTGYGGVTLEIPAGKLDPGETDPERAVRRELREETGAIAGRLTSLGSYYGSPAILDENIRMYLAEDLTFGETDFDEDEILAPVKMPLSDLVAMVLRGEIPDGKTQAAALRVYLMKQGDFSGGSPETK